LGLGTEGYSRAVLKKALRQSQKARSFRDASSDLHELAQLDISPTHLRTLALRFGRAWTKLRDADVQAFQKDQLPRGYAEPPQVAAVMVDGGTLQERAAEQGRGVQQPGWREYKSACCLTLSSQVSAQDPQPEPPAKFLEPAQAQRLASEIKSGRGKGPPRAARKDKQTVPKTKKKKAKGPRKSKPAQRVRTVLASMANSEAFGWQVAAEVQRRGLDRAGRKGYVCDGQKYNWSIYEMHLIALGFIGILDFIHLLAYLYWAAQALEGKGSEQAWQRYERWLRWAWAGRVGGLLEDLKAGSSRLGEPPEGCSEDDPRKVVADALGYVKNNQPRMDYPRYRRLGLPISSAPVESTIKQLNARVKGSEKFWLEGGAEALLMLRAAHLSEDGSADRYGARPRPYQRAVGEQRLRPAA
jgi:hypothetical protein